MLDRTEAIESVMEEIEVCIPTKKQEFFRNILKRLPDNDLFEIYQDLFADRGIRRSAV